MRRQVWVFFETLWPVVVMVCLFVCINSWLVQFARLSEADYRQPIIIVRFFGQLGWQGMAIGAVVLCLLWKSKFEIPQWHDLGSWHLRAFITLVAASLAWNFSVLDRNAYFAQWHLLDRILLVLCIPLIAYRPYGVFVFLLILIPFMNQFRHPGCLMFMYPEKHHLTDVLVLFSSYLLLRLNRKRDWPFYFVLLCLVAAHYWPSGIVKLRMHWLWENELSNMIFSSHANGWLAGWTNDSIMRIHYLMRWIDFPLRVFTLVIELAALCLLWNRRINLGIVFSWVLLHMGIAATSGICFLNWIVLDLGIVFLLRRPIAENRQSIFHWPGAVISTLLIFFGSYWVNTSTFAWFDTRMCYSYRLSAETESGGHYRVMPSSLAPYDFAFTWNLFEYLDSDKQLPIRYGNARSKEIARLVKQITTADELFAAEQEFGKVFYDEHMTETYREFVRTFFSELNRRPKSSWLGWIQRPADMISSRVDGAYGFESQIKAITVLQITTLFDDRQFREIRTKQLMRIEIP